MRKPYLFVLLMTCIARDISAEITERIEDNRIPGTNFDMVFYADDTVVVSRNLDAIAELLNLVENLRGIWSKAQH